MICRVEPARSFDTIAELYERVRPGYPNALFDDLMSLAGIRSGSRVLEIGCGTGKATRSLASRGLRIVALDPGAHLLRVAAAALGGSPQIEWVESTFEDWEPPAQRFQLVVAAQCIHWIDPEVAFRKPADALEPGGTFAVFGNVRTPLASALHSDLIEVYRRLAPQLAGLIAEQWYANDTDPVPKAFERCRRFGPVTRRVYRWALRYDAQSYTDLLRSQSAHQILPEKTREALLEAVATTVEQHGGDLEQPYETWMHLAQTC